MWVLITQRETPEPPQPQIPPGIQIPPVLPQGIANIDQFINEFDRQQSVATGVPQRTPISYCPWLWTDGGPNGFFNYVDADLRRILYECMYHRPEDRITVERLLEQAIEGAGRMYPGEDDQEQLVPMGFKYIYIRPSMARNPYARLQLTYLIPSLTLAREDGYDIS